MSARSPRGSISGTSDVALDFEESLKDLHQNNRYEISNLTLIAKESTEHAQAISKALENHIKTIHPNRKLPALYVLDSIVKNVGTPYTVYLGRNLYSTFMEAYLLVDNPTRRAMESLLKTWKEPVPGSMDPRPAFSADTVRPIENALIKARTAALQNRQHVQPQQVYRDTPTPPQYNAQFNVTPSQSHPQPFYGYGSQQPMPQQQPIQSYLPPTPTQHHYQQYTNAQAVSQLSQDVEALRRDIESLINGFKAQFVATPYNKDLQNKLQGLLNLQSYISTSAAQINAQSVQQIRTTVSSLAAALQPQTRPTPQPSMSIPSWQAPVSASAPSQSLPSSGPYVHPAAAVPPQPQPPAFNLAPATLNGLQALLANGQKPSTPQMRTAVPQLQNASHAQLQGVQNNINAATSANSTDLLTALARSGILSNPPPSTAISSLPIPPTAPAPAPIASSTAELLKSLQSILPPASQTGTPSMAPAQLTNGTSNISTTSASLKVFRPDLVRSLYDAQPNQCSTCGRRFLATEEGRAKKDRHLDWHFRTNQRVSDPTINRGSHRNWYVDEMEWIRLTDFDVSTTTAADADAATAAAAAANSSQATMTTKKLKGLQDQYVRAPAGVTRSTCNICAEELRSSYSEEQQDWVFQNATTLNGRTVHATCAEDIMKSSTQQVPIPMPMTTTTTTTTAGGGSLAAALQALGASRARSATPDSTSLGKRKADGVLAGTGARMKTG